MTTKKYLVMALSLLVALCLSYASYAEKNISKSKDPVSKTDAEVTAEAKELTKEEIIERLENIFQNNLDILAMIPGVERKGEGDSLTYEFENVNFEQLDRETLFGILRNANGQLSWKNYQKLERQLKNLKQIEQINRTQKMLRQLRSSNTSKRY